MAQNINDNEFQTKVLEASGTILIDFWAPWCGPCKQLSPLVDELSKDMSGQVTVYKCNVDDNAEAPSKYSVRGIPTLMIFKNGKLTDTKVGSMTKSALYEWVKNNI